MRKLYILGDEEFDEEFDSEKYDESDGCIENPTCPTCGRELLLAYVDGDELVVITWYDLLDEDRADADSWWLVCGNFECSYEEEVEPARKPAGATLFDVSDACRTFSAETDYDELNAVGSLELMQELKELQAHFPNRKLPSLIDGLQWKYDQHMEQIREWLPKVPAGRKISLHYEGQSLEGELVTYTNTNLVLRLDKGAETVVLPLEEVGFYGPQYFRDEEPEPPPPEEKHRFIVICPMERCVVRGYHLHLDEVDRFGRHHTRTWDEAAGKALGMKHLGGTCYQGVFRREQVDGRYRLRRLTKVAGHWMEWMGPTDKDDLTAVKTEDPELGKQLGFRPLTPWFPNEDGTWPPPSHWYGYVTREQIEEQEEHPVWYWPFPEAKGADR